MIPVTVKSRVLFKPYFNHIARENFLKPLPIIILFFTLVNLFLLLNYFFRWFYFSLTFPWIQVALVVTVMIVVPLYFYFNNRNEFYANIPMQEYKVFEFTDIDVRISNSSSSVLIEWQNFYKVEESKEFLILFYDYATAYFILKSDFESDEQLQQVFDIIKTKSGLVQAFLK